MTRRRLGLGALALAVALVVGLHAAAIFRTAFNWDEFVLLDHVARSLDERVLVSGGHGGLAELLLAPLVEGCSDEIAVARRARGIWLLLTLAYLAGVGALLAALLRSRPHRAHDAALGVALLGLLPAFLEWSVQVRTDQLALVGGVWGGVALLVSRRRPRLALAAGFSFGIGWVANQKLAYVAALMGLLAVGDLLLAREWRPRREGIRATLAAAAFAATCLGFRALVGALFLIPEGHPAERVFEPRRVENYLTTFGFYRKTIGYSQYVEMLPSLLPQAALLLCAALATLCALRQRRPVGELVLAWAVVALGVGVGAFHAAAFAYFWMTLGLFPVVAVALALQPIREELGAERARPLRAATAVVWLAIAGPGALRTLDLLRDTQAVQRESLAFVHRNFAPEDAGFHPESGLFCGASQPLGLWLSQNIYRHFAGGRGGERFLERFREEPVHYLVQSFRLNQFPLELRRFWAENYQPYRASVFVAGWRLAGRRGGVHEFEVVVPGRYRWLPLARASSVLVDGGVVKPGDTLVLNGPRHTATFVEDETVGVLVLAVNDPPGPSPLAFYKTY